MKEIFSKKSGLLVAAALAVVACFAPATPVAAVAGCAVPTTNYGIATGTLTIPTAGTYYIWSRIMPADSTNNSYMLEVDGSSCYTVGGSSSIAANSWTWVNYQNGSSSSKISQTLTAGSHSIRFIGTTPSLKIDRVMAVTDSSCTPTSTGDNCAVATDSAAPSVTINSPSLGATVSGTVTVNATVTDDVGVSKVEFYVDNTLQSTNTATPYSFSWNTTALADGDHSIAIKAYDATGNIGMISQSVSVKNTDSEVPTTPTSVTATADSSTQVTLNWTASTDNTGVTNYSILRDGAAIGSSTTNSYVDSTVVSGTTYNYQVVAYDASSNKSSSSTAVSVSTPTVTTADTEAPTTPVNVSATAASTSQINVSWSASTDNSGVAKYNVYRSTGSGQATKVASVSTLTYGDTGLSAGTSYTYYVVAEDVTGNTSANSSTTTATTQTATSTSSTTGSGDVRGKVTGSNGRAVSGTKVVIVANGRKYITTTNNRGIYRIYGIPAGKYTVQSSQSSQSSESSQSSGGSYQYQSTVSSVSVNSNQQTVSNTRLNRK